MSQIVCYNCGKPGHYAKDCRSKKKERHASPGRASSSGSDGGGQVCHFHKPWAKPPQKCSKGDRCTYLHVDEKPKKGTPGIACPECGLEEADSSPENKPTVTCLKPRILAYVYLGRAQRRRGRGLAEKLPLRAADPRVRALLLQMSL